MVDRGYRSAAPFDLGAPQERYEQSKTLVSRILSNLVLGGPGALLAGRALVNDVPVFANDAPWPINAAWALLLVGLPALSLVLIVQSLRHRNDRVIAYEHGLVVELLGRETRIPFADIRVLQSTVRRTKGGVIHSHRIRWSGIDSGDRAREIVLTQDYARIEELVDRVRRASAEHLVPRAQEDLASGRSVDFGPITLTADALAVRGTKLPLAVLDRVQLRHGWLYVHAKGRSAAWATHDPNTIPNLHVLLSVLPRVPADEASAK